MVFQIHDEIIMECPKKNSKQVSEILNNIMINSVNELRMDIKMKCDVVIEDRWGETPMTEEIKTKFLDYKKRIGEEKLSGDPLTMVIDEFPNIPKESIERVIKNNDVLKF